MYQKGLNAYAGNRLMAFTTANKEPSHLYDIITFTLITMFAISSTGAKTSRTNG